MVLHCRKPLNVRVGRQHRMRVEGNEAHLVDLRNFEVPQHLCGEILVYKLALPESERLAGDLSFAIAYEKDVHRPQHGKRDPPDHASFRSVVEPTFFDPAGIAELLRHVSTRTIHESLLRRPILSRGAHCSQVAMGLGLFSSTY